MNFGWLASLKSGPGRAKCPIQGQTGICLFLPWRVKVKVKKGNQKNIVYLRAVEKLWKLLDFWIELEFILYFLVLEKMTAVGHRPAKSWKNPLHIYGN